MRTKYALKSLKKLKYVNKTKSGFSLIFIFIAYNQQNSKKLMRG